MELEKTLFLPMGIHCAVLRLGQLRTARERMNPILNPDRGRGADVTRISIDQDQKLEWRGHWAVIRS